MCNNHRAVVLSLSVVLVGHSAALYSAPLFYLSDQPLGVAQPGAFSLNNPASGTTGQLNIYAMTDVRLAGVSLDLLASGGGIRFRGLDVVNDGRWWILDGPQVIEDSKITSIGGGALPGVEGAGIGPGDFTDANFHPASGYLLATVDYEVLDASVPSSFELKVGNNTVADWQGESPMVHFGDLSQPAVPGYPPHVEQLPKLQVAAPRLPPSTPVPDPIQHPVQLPPKPNVVGPPPHPNSLGPDPTISEGTVDVPAPWHPFVLRLGDLDEDTQRRFVPTEVDQAIDMSRFPIDIDDTPSYDYSFYLSRFNGPTRTDDNEYLYSVSPIFIAGGTISDATAFATFGGLAATGSLDLSPNVPEPATIALAALAILAIAGLRSDRRS